MGNSDHRPRKDFDPVGAVLAGHGGTALCFPVPAAQLSECGGRPWPLQCRAEKYHDFGYFSPQIEKINGESPFFPKQQHLLNKNILLFYRVLREGMGSTDGQIFQAAKHLKPPNTVCLFCARHC